jgi:hypothetical protein
MAVLQELRLASLSQISLFNKIRGFSVALADFRVEG